MTVELDWEQAIENLDKLDTASIAQIASKCLHILESRAEHPTKDFFIRVGF